MPKKGKSSKAPQDIAMHIAFKDVNSGINKLVAGRTVVSRDKGTSSFGRGSSMPQRGLNHTTTKAIDVDINPKDQKSMFEARMVVVRDFLKKVRPEDRLFLATDDADFLDIVEGQGKGVKKAAAAWKKFSKDLNIEVIDVRGQFEDSQGEFDDEEMSDMELAHKAALFRINKLTKPEGGTKGYVRQNYL
jgi:hypothetical protein